MGNGLQPSIPRWHLEKKEPSRIYFYLLFKLSESLLKHGIFPISLKGNLGNLLEKNSAIFIKSLTIFRLFGPEIALLGIYPVTSRSQPSPSCGYRGLCSSVLSAEEPRPPQLKLPSLCCLSSKYLSAGEMTSGNCHRG